jgi:translocation protein SEC62
MAAALRATSPEIMALTSYLHSSIQSEDAIAIERRVQIFKGKHALEALLSPSYAAKAGKSLPTINGEEAAKQYLKRMISMGMIIKASVKGTKTIPLTAFQQAAASQGGPNAPQPTRIMVVEPDPSFTWSDDGYYIWLYSGNQALTYLKSFLLIVLVFALVMYPLWPYQLRSGSWYLAMLGVSLIGLLMVTAVIRLIIYCFSRVVGKGFWLFPNLFEDCGFFESFVPLYAWEEPSASSTKKHTS